MKEIMLDISVIIPLHKYDNDVKELLIESVNSVPEEYEVRISCAYGLKEQLEKLNLRKNIVFVESEENGDTSFASLVNQAVGGTKWFSILEYDDVYTRIWFDNVEKYIKFYPEISVFLPLTDLVDFNEKKFIGYGNEAPWASSFSNEIGYIDNDCLQQFFDFYLTGSVFNTEDWNNNGGLKPSIKITFWYEFLLRLTNNGKKVFVIPKIGYTHLVNRNGSLYDEYRHTITEKESAWWFDLAKKECFFKADRNKTYENNKEKGEE